MTDSIELEIEDEVAMMLEKLKAEHGEEQVEADLRRAVRQAVAQGYATL